MSYECMAFFIVVIGFEMSSVVPEKCCILSEVWESKKESFIY